jgi:hypothetical protein
MEETTSWNVVQTTDLMSGISSSSSAQWSVYNILIYLYLKISKIIFGPYVTVARFVKRRVVKVFSANTTLIELSSYLDQGPANDVVLWYHHCLRAYGS